LSQPSTTTLGPIQPPLVKLYEQILPYYHHAYSYNQKINQQMHLVKHNKIQFMTSMFWHRGTILRESSTILHQPTLHTLHLDEIPLDHTDRDRCLYTYSRQNKNGHHFVIEVAHYHAVLISKHYACQIYVF